MTKMQVLMLVHLLAKMMGKEMLCPGLINSSMLWAHSFLQAVTTGAHCAGAESEAASTEHPQMAGWRHHLQQVADWSHHDWFLHTVQVNLASFPGSSAPEREIELVHAERAWYFSHVSTAKGRAEVTL